MKSVSNANAFGIIGYTIGRKTFAFLVYTLRYFTLKRQ